MYRNMPDLSFNFEDKEEIKRDSWCKQKKINSKYL